MTGEPATVRRADAPGSWLPDVLGAALAVAFLTLVTHHFAPQPGERALDALGYGLLALAGGALVLCRRRPVVATGLVTAALAVYILRRYVGGPIYVTGWIALFALSWRTNRRTAVIGAVAVCAVLGVAALLGVASPSCRCCSSAGRRPRCSSATSCATGGATWPSSRSGPTTWSRRVRRRPADGSRRSGCGSPATCTTASPTPWRPSTCRPAPPRTWSTGDPRPPRRRWRRSSERARDVLDELAALLGLLRDDGEQADAGADAGPVRQSPDLVAALDAPGCAVTLEVDGPVETVPSPVGTAAYRIVQESLTNVIRHAGATHARVAVRVAARPWTDGRGPRRRRRCTATPSNGTGLGHAGHAGAGRVDRRARSRPGPGRAAASSCGRRGTAGRDPGRARRRPGARAGRVPHAARRRGRHRGRGRGRRRRGRARRSCARCGPTSC